MKVLGIIFRKNDKGFDYGIKVTSLKYQNSRFIRNDKGLDYGIIKF